MMIRSILPVLFLMLFGNVISAQIIAPTTMEEYNYGAIGYKIQLQARLDTKAGYKLVPAEGCEEPERKIEYQLMYRDEDSIPCAVILIFTKTRNAPLYYCIPTANASPEIWDKFNKSLAIGTDNPSEQLQFFTKCISYLMMNLATGRP